MIRVGLIGARGYAGREMLRLIAGHPELELAFASSRELAGRPVRDAAPEVEDDVAFEALSPDEASARGADAIILGLPNGASRSFVERFDAVSPDAILVDLSGDHRADPAWVYGLPEISGRLLAGVRRIANPGCYATAAQLALKPVASRITGPATVFGVSGWSGAGTTPSRRNNPDALRDNVQPYGLAAHAHEPEIARGAGCEIRFFPSVAPFFRGLTVIVSARMAHHADAESLRRLYDDAYRGAAFVRLQDDPAEPVSVSGTHLCVIGGVTARAGGDVVATAALDNLLKGAASQAVQNLNIALGLDETTGLTPKETP